MLVRRTRAGRSTFGTLVWILLLAVLLGGGYLYGRKWWDAQSMKEIVRLSLREWHVTAVKSSATSRYAREMEERNMPFYIPDDACAFSLNDSGDKQAYCWWDATIDLPLVDHQVPLQFEFWTIIDPRGRIEEW